MKAILLAGGISSRFYPFNKLGHKSLITLLGEPLIIHTLESIHKSGINDVVIVEGVNQDVSYSIKDKIPSGMKVKYVVQEEATGMGEALLLCEKLLDDNPFFLLSSYHFDFNEFSAKLQDAGKKGIALLTQKSDDLSQFGSISRSGKKIRIFEKPKENKTGDKIVGIYLLNKQFVDVLKNEKKEHYSFEKALGAYSDVNSVSLVEASTQTVVLKFPWDLLSVKDYLLENLESKISKTSFVSKTATISGKVVIEEGAKIMDNAVIHGPAYIGKNAYIGNNSILRHGTVVEGGAVVGANLEVKNSILMVGATTHSGFIGDSVIGENTKIAADFITGNVRLDRHEISKKVKNEIIDTKRKSLGAFIGSTSNIGIKVSTMPGLIIGNGVVVGPGTTVMEDISDNTTYYTEFKKIVKKPRLA